MEKLNLDKITLKKFSIVMFTALVAIGTISLLRHKEYYSWFYLLGILFFLLGLVATNLLKPIYVFWMRLAFILGWINTRLLLLLIFYFVFTPMGLVMRLFGADLLDRKIEKEKKSYWRAKDKKQFSFLNYEKQF